MVEFGWNVPNVNLGTMEKPQDMIQYYENIQERIINSGGDYYAAIGKIKSFNYDIGPNGEFDCNTELTSMGSTLFKGCNRYTRTYTRSYSTEEQRKDCRCI